MTDVYCALVHYPVRAKDGSTVTTAVTNLDVHDIARLARTFELRGYFIVTPIEAQRQLVERILAHWRDGGGKKRIPNRADALSRVRVVDTIEAAAEVIAQEARGTQEPGTAPRRIATAARSSGRELGSYAAEAKLLAAEGPPALLLFGTGHGLADSVLDEADTLLPPIAGRGDYNHLSVRAAAAITVDRLLGDRNSAE